MFLRHLFTGKDNQTADIGRVIWFAGALVFMVLGIVAVLVKGQAFTPIDYGVGFGSIMAGGGGSLGMKAKTEPECKGDTRE